MTRVRDEGVSHQKEFRMASTTNVATMSGNEAQQVKALAFSESNGVALRNYPAYLRDWIDRESAHTKSTESEQGEHID
jgi:hypothetical protein